MDFKMNIKLNNKSFLEARKGDLLVTKDAMYLVISLPLLLKQK